MILYDLFFWTTFLFHLDSHSLKHLVFSSSSLRMTSTIIFIMRDVRMDGESVYTMEPDE